MPTKPESHGPMPGLWFWKRDIQIAYRFGQILLRDATLGIQNEIEMTSAERRIGNLENNVTVDDVPLPEGFPEPRLALPQKRFAPDYFSCGAYRFCSKRLRDALAQPKHVVQFSPVALVAGGEKAQIQDYRLMRVLAHQSAMDIERSDCKLEEFTNAVTGEQTKYPRWVSRFVFLEKLKPQTEIFRLSETNIDILVIDAVAARVLQAGCTGIEFSDPTNLQSGKRVERYRTTDGVAERRVGFLD